MRLIDADALIKKVECLFKDLNSTEDYMGIGYNHGVGDGIATIKNAPTIDYPIEQIKWERDVAIEQLKFIGKGLGEKMDDVKPVKTGKWIEATNDDPCYYYCSECHWLSDIKTPYCPNCGARMGENDE
ncbi:MAG: hypothetical protein IJG87_02125 [Ruminococcus sp.]|nr:hypothetical protein [Ruminococcus sp.]